jgi:hypothetical protein
LYFFIVDKNSYTRPKNIHEKFHENEFFPIKKQLFESQRGAIEKGPVELLSAPAQCDSTWSCKNGPAMAEGE